MPFIRTPSCIWDIDFITPYHFIRCGMLGKGREGEMQDYFEDFGKARWL